ncbi:MAG TPA: hypothetical protein VLA19_15095 [Herpetosiphonaceae bacterium]|nr:hypothetical protein [Herpetosiphonaceae bacterium]
MQQLALPIEVPPATPPTSAGLDRATVLRLKAAGIGYHGTRWSPYWQTWLHAVEVSTPASRHIVMKTDQGITALLALMEAV